MSRNKNGSKAGRKAKHIAFSKAMKERKKLRKQRRQQNGVQTHKEKFEQARAENPGERLMTTKQGEVVTHRSVHEFELSGGTVEGWPVTLTSEHPTEEEWTEVLAEAKRRKKSVVKMAEQNGFRLAILDVGDKTALRLRTSYTRIETEGVAA